jgi:outer membrane protein assembly factor BamA
MRWRAAALACVAIRALAGCSGEKAEGRPWIRHVTFSGVRRADEKELRSKIALEPRSWFPFAPKHYLDPFTVDADRERIEAWYRAHGWFGARVTGAEVTPAKPGAVDVHISVDEGEPTRIRAVALSGLESLGRPAEKIERALRERLVVGATFDHQRYLDAKQLLEDRLKKLGYAWALVDGEVEVDRDHRTADLRLAARPGVLTRFGFVHVTGTVKVDPRRVALHAGIRPGERFDPDLIEQARGAVYHLGLFSTVQVEYVHIAEREDVADVMVRVREGTFNELRVAGGVEVESLRNDIHASVIYTRRNLFGGLRTLRLTALPAYVFIPAVWNVTRHGPALRADATLTQPDVPWPLARLTFTLGFDVDIDYGYQYFGPRVQLAILRGFWRDRLLLSAAYNFQFLKFFNTDPAFFLDPSSGKLFGFVDPYRLAWYQEDVALDLRDRPLDAHRGLYASLSAEQGGPWAGGAFEYEKLVPDVRAYLPLGRRVTIAARLQFGQIFTQGTLGSPTTRRLYLGGPNSHRGFAYNRLSLQVPSGIYGVPPIPIGGDQSVLLQGEVRVDIVKLFGQWLSLAAFLDAGDVAAPTCVAGADPNSTCQVFFGRLSHSVNWGDLYYATGGGLRYRTLIGTVRVDLGVRLNRLTEREPDGTPNADPGQRFAFHISVGESF